MGAPTHASLQVSGAARTLAPVEKPQNFFRVAQGIPVEGALEQLRAHEELWNQRPERTNYATSPHREVDDIWLRCAPLGAKYTEPHMSVFTPAWNALPALHPIVYGLMAWLPAVQLGGVLLTRLAPGREVYAHADAGWHPFFYNAKVYVGLQSDLGCENWFEDASFHMLPGEAWLFNNLVEHGVRNNSQRERIALIVSMRVER